ncbi:membrane protein [Mycobacterium phage DrHayes]|uniref:Membrane protein n=1 Tax=Mycobacterium phage Urkel TaxID=1912978 RepID=A0A1I9S4W1_9CAUD|nr:membrane protein [Mycobacterium phage Urkel]AOZ61411.1 membrane protein [Mycobacterium phage SamuelLPlaqson]AOZ61508.1 membrane protein [Mycobacterium phage DrHayes]AOZ61605.1 membrane protein [Mycobacterium phage Urkel]
MSAVLTPRESAQRYFRGWLAAGVVTSILGNAAHALLDPDAGSKFIAAAVAVLLPLGILGSTHGVHKLVAAGIVGRAYTAALCISVTVVAAAFLLSFAALAELAVDWAGISVWLCWLVPVFIDLSIAGCTVALFALSGAERGEVLDAAVHVAAQVVHPAAHAVAQPADLHVPLPADLQPETHLVAREADGLVHVFEESVHDPAPAGVSVADLIAREAATGDALAVHLPAAEAILAAGVTRIDRVKVAEVLAEHAADVKPSMIARKLGVGYSTVVRILDHHTAQDGAPAEVLDAEVLAS